MPVKKIYYTEGYYIIFNESVLKSLGLNIHFQFIPDPIYFRGLNGALSRVVIKQSGIMALKRCLSIIVFCQFQSNVNPLKRAE